MHRNLCEQYTHGSYLKYFESGGQQEQIGQLYVFTGRTKGRNRKINRRIGQSYGERERYHKICQLYDI